MGKRVIVISGINLVDGGPISVFIDLLNTIVEMGYSKNNKIIALVAKKDLFLQFKNDMQLIEFKKSKKNWIYRLYYEYVYFNKLSKRLDVDIWISMHDITPNVRAKHKYVYCHNPSPFNKMSIKDAKFGWKYYAFSKFYKYLYKINIQKNDAVIVQQKWMRDKFKEIYKLKNVIVARPSMPSVKKIADLSSFEQTIFVFPSFPRYYKNFQVVCEAVKILKCENIENFTLYITLSGNENKYANFLKEKYGYLNCINFCGLLSRDDLFKLYEKSSCLIFMSKLETWGMPITEYKTTGKTMILSNLPYAHETVGNYDNVKFIDPDDSEALAKVMKNVIEKKITNSCARIEEIDQPFAEGWSQLCRMILK